MSDDLAMDETARLYHGRYIDRIGELEAAIDWQIGRAETAEAKLAKAVYAMEVWLQAQEPDIDIAIKLMHDTLAELKGQDDE